MVTHHVISLNMVVSILVPAHRSVTPLAIDKCDSRNLVLIVIVLVFITSLDELLLGLLQSKRSHEALSITGHIDVCHVTWVVDPWFPLQIDQGVMVLPIALWIVRCSWRKGLTLVNHLLVPGAVEVVLACVAG